MAFTDIDVFVFDLDGTLYDDKHHFIYLKNELKKRIVPSLDESFEADFQKILNNQHHLKVGTVYDTEHQWIIYYKNHQATAVYDWDGNEIEEKEWNELYTQTFPIKTKSLFPIGDFWELLGVAAFHYEIQIDTFLDAFFSTRRYMMSDHYQMKPIEQIQPTFKQLSQFKKMVLMTNSSEDDGRQLLKKIGIHDYFHHYIFNAKKPKNTKEHLTSIQQMFDVPYERILSIGDNFKNEIIPAKQLNCKTICIDPYQIGHQSSIDLHLKSPVELVPALQKLLK
ncbi:MAG TPA: HAD family hydrolase [Massilibacterium sp.]|nr:HAD family hydrolase [Massilibacterium sp.]